MIMNTFIHSFGKTDMLLNPQMNKFDIYLISGNLSHYSHLQLGLNVAFLVMIHLTFICDIKEILSDVYLSAYLALV